MSCEKCIHEKVCDQASRQMWGAMAGEKECTDFQDDMHMVEVVYCEECLFLSFGRCTIHRIDAGGAFYCACGMRKDGADNDR